MKILFVSQYFYPEIFKGNDIVFDLVERGHEVTVLTGKPNYPEGKFYKGYNFFNKNTEYIQGAKVIRTPLFPRRSGKALPLILNYLSFIFFSYFVVFFRLRDKFDLIFVQQLSPVTMALPGLWMKRRQKTPLFLWVLDLWPESITANSTIKKGFIINFIEKLVKNIYNKSDVILISSRFFKNSILEKCNDKSKRIIHFPNWAEDVFENVKEISSKIPDLPLGFNIMFAGNIGESQGFEAILDTVELTKNEDINWIIIGDGRKVNWIKKEIKNRKLSKIHLLGRYPLETMPHFFKMADVMLVSLKDEPIFELTVPAKVQAYMASGKPILGILNGEGKILINESKCGFAVTAGDSLALANKSIEMSKFSIAQIKEICKNSLDFYNQNFLKEKLLNQLEELLIKEKIK